MGDFGNKLIDWYNANRRNLPWRSTKDPYKIWLSEVILQQTRVAQGLSYYEKFVEHYPSVKDLANASEDEVLSLWQGLGYYSRGRNLRKAAIQVVEEFKGEFPNSFKRLKTLKGVGDYTAAAIASISFGEKVPVVDGNVYRVLSRYFADRTEIQTPKAYKLFYDYASVLMEGHDPDTFNQAIMELGALICAPTNPSCDLCPVVNGCKISGTDKWKQFPVKKRSMPRKERYFHYLILVDDNQKIAIQRRVKGDIWEGLYELPLIESEKGKLPISKLERLFYYFHIEAVEEEKKHVLTHQIIFPTFVKISEFDLRDKHSFKWISKKDLERYAFPVLFKKQLECFKLSTNKLI